MTYGIGMILPVLPAASTVQRSITNRRQCGAGLVQSSYFSMDTAKMPAGMGSGFIWDDKGHVVTNYHVIKDANEVQVTLVDQSVWPAKVRRRLSVSQLARASRTTHHAEWWSAWATNQAVQIQYFNRCNSKYCSNITVHPRCQWTSPHMLSGPCVDRKLVVR